METSKIVNSNITYHNIEYMSMCCWVISPFMILPAGCAEARTGRYCFYSRADVWVFGDTLHRLRWGLASKRGRTVPSGRNFAHTRRNHLCKFCDDRLRGFSVARSILSFSIGFRRRPYNTLMYTRIKIFRCLITGSHKKTVKFAEVVPKTMGSATICVHRNTVKACIKKIGGLFIGDDL